MTTVAPRRPPPASIPSVPPGKLLRVDYVDRPGTTPGLSTTACLAIAGMVVIMLALIAGGIAAFVGCASTDPAADPKVSLPMARQTVAEVAADLPPRADKIDAAADGIAAKTRPADARLYGPFLETIHVNAAGVRDDGKRLAPVAPQLAAATVAVVATEAKVDKLEEQQRSTLTRHLPWLIGGGVVLAAAAAGLFLAGLPKPAVIVAGVGGTLTVAAIVVQQLVEWVVPLVVGLVVVTALGLLVYELVKHRKELAVHKDTIIPELIQTGEVYKQLADPMVKAAVNGVGAVPGKADQIQSSVTQAAVKAVRAGGGVRLAVPGPTPAATTATSSATTAR